jgi:very-short-patch-repair endonuclease
LIDGKLEELRRGLVDLTRNNRLLNHRTKGQRSLSIYRASAPDVYKQLVDNRQTLQFLARDDASSALRNSLPSEESATAESDELDPAYSDAQLGSADSGGGTISSEAGLQTLLTGDRLQTRLLNLFREAHSASEEQGSNILFCTFGMVEWREAEESSVASRAPLIFVPIELKRKTVSTRFTMSLLDDDVFANSSLAELCQATFGFALPAFDTDKLSLLEYFSAVEQSIADLKGWRLVREVNVGLYSFQKMQMFRDLDPANWPDATKLTGHPMVRYLSGVDGYSPPGGGGALLDTRDLDETQRPHDCFQVVDADSSQQRAILAAKRGTSLVIDGPPGTGKSQTITNIIAECLSDGRTVLFVAEKSAAIEVVKCRLSGVGLGDFVLDIHGREANKKAVVDEINRVLEKQPTAARTSTAIADELESTRATLNAYARDLHDDFGASNCSPFKMMSRASAFQNEPEATAVIPDVAAWTEAQLSDAVKQLQLLDARLARVGDPGTHAWRGIGLTSAGLKEKQEIRVSRDKLGAAINEVGRTASQVGRILGRAVPNNIKELEDWIGTAQKIAGVGDGISAVIEDDRWNSQRDSTIRWIAVGREWQLSKQKWTGIARADADQQNWEGVLRRRREQGRSFFRWLRPSWRADDRQIRSILIGGVLPPLTKQCELLREIIASNQFRQTVERDAVEYGPRFGGLFTGPECDWDSLARFISEADDLRRLVQLQKIGAAVLVRILDTPDKFGLAAKADALRTGIDRLSDAWNRWLAVLGTREKQWLKGDWNTTSLPLVLKRITELEMEADGLGDWIDFIKSYRALSHTSLRPFADWALSPGGKIARGRLAATFQRHFYRLWLDEAFLHRPSLAEFRGQDHEAVVQQFRKLDDQWIKMAKFRLAEVLNKRRPAMTESPHRQSKLGLIKAEARKKIRHMPLRKLFKEAGEVIQAIKPCFMMSPLSVAQHLAPGGLEFDVAIFDEASQIEPSDAFGAIARSKQVILVGDEKQLPPTSFFGRNDEDAEPTGDESEVHSADLKSILSVGIVRSLQRNALRWHYRSKHSSLIDFSNIKFYDGGLLLFPSPHTSHDKREKYGLSFRYVENGVYSRGEGRFNEVEARAVAEAVIRHARECPGLSLGVGTLNQPQQRRILEVLDKLREAAKNDKRIEDFFSETHREKFFVKNLENIQGDERDVIFLSVCFGKDRNGKFSASFGALNGDGGWKRLNVLVTRARQRCVVFSSITADDIAVTKSSPLGVVRLKEYLEAAKTGRLKDAAVAGGDFDSDFEKEVCRAVREAGWEVQAQVGCAGFSIDLAVVDPKHPGRYLLGIECDGATFHSSPTARDRDRLRQSVLEDLGWKIHRIWSTDWFHRPGPTLQAVLEKLKMLDEAERVKELPKVHGQPDRDETEQASENLPEQSAGAPDPAAHPEHAGHIEAETVVYRHERNTSRVGTADTLFSHPMNELVNISLRIVSVEGPIHVDEALRAFSELFGTKATSRPRQVFQQAAALAIRNGWVIKKGDFLWPTDLTDALVRSRAGDCPVTDPEMIPPEELEAAIMLVVRRQYGIKFEYAVEAAARLFGFARTGSKLRAVLEGALIRLAERREIDRDDSDFITVPREGSKQL